MKKTVVFLAVTALLAGSGFYGATWYGTYRALERVKAETASFGVLQWGRIMPGFSGEVHVEQLRFSPFELNQPVRIGSVAVAAGSARELLEWLFDGSTALPPQGRLTLNDAHMVLRPDLTKAWVSVPGDAPRWPRPWELRACGIRTTLTGADLMTMGIDVLDMDADLRWHRDGSRSSIRGEINAGALGSVDFVGDGIELEQTLGQIAEGGPPHWDALQVTVRDGGFMRRLAAFCTRDQHESPQDWALVEAERLQESLASWGIQPGIQLATLYRQWLYQGGSVLVELPETGSDGLASATVVAGYLKQGVQIRYNGQPLADLDISLVPADFVARSRSLAPTPMVRPAQADTAEWRATPPATLPQWLDRQVQVTLASGRSLEGRLSGINERQLQIARFVNGGEFASSADRKEIAELAVWRRQGEVPVLPQEPAREAGTGAEAGDDKGAVDNSPALESGGAAEPASLDPGPATDYGPFAEKPIY